MLTKRFAKIVDVTFITNEYAREVIKEKIEPRTPSWLLTAFMKYTSSLSTQLKALERSMGLMAG